MEACQAQKNHSFWVWETNHTVSDTKAAEIGAFSATIFENWAQASVLQCIGPIPEFAGYADLIFHPGKLHIVQPQ